MSKKGKQHKFDFLIIGSGIAGLNFALSAAKHRRVAVITKKELMESNSNYAQGGIAAVLDRHDSFDQHIKDTLEAGCYLNDRKAVEIMVKEGPKAIQRLITMGAGFNRESNKIALTKEGGHSACRIAHAKDATGREIERALIHNVRRHKNISTFESHLAIDLMVWENECLGAVVLNDETKDREFFLAKAVILATGGLGQVYQRNCNPKIATGDGFAMAERAGAFIKHMEFVQFHPTALAKKGQPTFLISETVRGEGGILKNSQGREFMAEYHPWKELAPRDIVSRAVFEQLKLGPVYLDIRRRGSKFIKERFPYIYDKLWWYGIRMDKDMIPVAPAAHYACGGVHTDLNGQTSIKWLYAIGEVAHTGVHGGNRLASNSLLECVVFSHRASRAAVKEIKDRRFKSSLAVEMFNINLPPVKRRHRIDSRITLLRNRIKNIMWKRVGIVRREEYMKRALAELCLIVGETEKIYNKGVNRETIELRNLAQVAVLICQAAVDRKESACAHFIK